MISDFEIIIFLEVFPHQDSQRILWNVQINMDKDLNDVLDNTQISRYNDSQFYKNIDQIQEVFEDMYIESWKMSKWSRNFRDYYDCRPAFANWEPPKELMDSRLEYLNNLVGSIAGWNDVAIEKSLELRKLV